MISGIWYSKSMKVAYILTTQKGFRNHFWFNHPEFASLRRSRKTQNDYPADVRAAFVEFVDAEQKAGFITEKLAQKITLWKKLIQHLRKQKSGQNILGLSENVSPTKAPAESWKIPLTFNSKINNLKSCTHLKLF